MKVKTVDGLAKALVDNDWVASKTTDKTIAIMAGLNNIPWDKVKLFSLRWSTENGEIVPIVNVMMQGPNYDETESDEAVEIDIELLDKEEEKEI